MQLYVYESMTIQTIFVNSYEDCLVIFLKRAAERQSAHCILSGFMELDSPLLFIQKTIFHYSWIFFFFYLNIKMSFKFNIKRMCR